MPTRREFFQRGIALAAFAARPPTIKEALERLASADSEQPHQFFKIVFDRTFAVEGEAFGAEGVRRGIPVEAVGSDIGGVWMNDIEPRWKHTPAAVAGITGGASLFCLELLARDYGMRLVYRAEHAFGGGGFVRHTIAGPAALFAWERRACSGRSKLGRSRGGHGLHLPQAFGAGYKHRPVGFGRKRECRAHSVFLGDGAGYET